MGRAVRSFSASVNASLVSPEDFLLAFEACSYDLILSGEGGRWCAAFSEDDVQVALYAADLKLYVRTTPHLRALGAACEGFHGRGVSPRQGASRASSGGSVSPPDNPGFCPPPAWKNATS